MAFYPQERLALFIDGPNLYNAARALNFDIDYRRLLQLFQSKGRLIRAFYYTAISEDQDYSPIRPLVDWLDYNGFTMVTKPMKDFTDSQGRRRFRASMDIEIAVDMMDLADKLDHVVLFSGDGNFPPPGRIRPASRRPCVGRLDDPHPAADGFRRTAPSGRHVHRTVRSCPAHPARRRRASRWCERGPRHAAGVAAGFARQRLTFHPCSDRHGTASCARASWRSARRCAPHIRLGTMRPSRVSGRSTHSCSSSALRLASKGPTGQGGPSPAISRVTYFIRRSRNTSSRAGPTVPGARMRPGFPTISN